MENKPTFKISEEMHNKLLERFSNSMAVKEKADQIIIGQRQSKDAIPPLVIPDIPVPPVVEEAPTPEPESEPAKEEATVEEAPVDEVIKAEASPSGLKVVGKIDLDAEKEEAPAPEPEPEPEPKEEEKETPEVAVAEEAPEEKETNEPEEAPEAKQKTDEKKEEEIVKVEAPTLAGLKILGKIDTKKFEKKKEEKPKQENKPKPKPGPSDGRQKRRRTRKKINPDQYRREQGRKRNQTDEVKTVSAKEIEEKIKATMARISGGGKNKRQKIRRDSRAEKREKQEMREMAEDSSVLKLTEFISVAEFASLMGVTPTEVITKCMGLGVFVSINQRLDAEIIELVATEFGHKIEFIDVEEEGEEEDEIVDAPEDLLPRAPIVTVMGHVDHGKTSLLDYIRNANVASGEAGGITQHIGAYEVAVGEEKKRITFLDTPGHEAFTAMRARGAKVTDVVVVIIAADDKVMPQTKEAIAHSQAAGVPMIFAINKIDKDGANPDLIKTELAEMNLQVEEWGGKYQSQDISAKTGLNIDALLEKIVLEAEMLDLKANPSRPAIGAVLEASLDKGRGYVTKILIETGTLKIGDPIVAGSQSGKVKAMFNDRGKRIKEAGPSQPVLILGLDGAPQAGEKIKVVESEQEAKSMAGKRSQIDREVTNRASKRISLDEIGRRIALGNFKELNLIVKGDVDGSIEALSDSLIKLSQETVQVNVIHKAVGQIIESDVLLASASDAIIVGFQVRPSLSARQLAEKEGVQIKSYSIIYEAIDEIKLAIEGMLEPTEEEKMMAQVEIRETFKISKVGTIAGCFVQDGVITRNTKIRVIRDGIVIYPTKEGVVGELASLKRFKDDAKEVKKGLECGLSIKNFNDLKVGDIIEGYDIVKIKQTIK